MTGTKPEHNPERQDLPEEGADFIITRLESFRPKPSARFYELTREAPWKDKEPENQFSEDPVIHLIPARRRRFRPSWGLAILMLAMIVLIMALITPTLQVTAQIFARFFSHAEGDVTIVNITPAGPGQLEPPFDLSHAEAQALAGFDLKAAAGLPSSIYLEGAAYNPDQKAVTMSYRSQLSNMVLRLSQRRLVSAESYTSIGVSAEVEPVEIAGNPGEYVKGGWRLPLLATQVEAIAPGMEVTLEAHWTPQSEIQILRWQEGEILYEIVYVRGTRPDPAAMTKNDLILLAQNLE